MKRFTETGKWDDPWFRQLPGVHKLVFLYVIDRCNNAGFWEVDCDAIAWHTKVDPKHIEGAWKGLERGIIGACGWVWVKRFLRHQKNEVLNENNPAHKQIIILFKEQHDRFKEKPEFLEFIAPYKGLLSPIGTGTGTGKRGGTGGEFKVPSDTGAGLRDKFEEWMTFRRGLGKKPKDWCAMFTEQWKWLAPFGETQAVAILSQSIRNGWQGLFELKTAGRNGHAQPADSPIKTKRDRDYEEFKRKQRQETTK